MAVFSKNMNPLDGHDIGADLRRVEEHIAYMQEAIEFSANRQERRLKALEGNIGTAAKEAETHGNP